jgi:4-hydroxybenzoate polyprenyltransferase
MVVLTTCGSFVCGQHGIALLYVFIATASGQASIGWVNDYVDQRFDKQNNRTHKPLVSDSLDRNFLKIPIAIALFISIPFSFLAAGWFGGLANILAIANAQLYNLYLSRTVWSWLPYAVSFGLLTVFVTQSTEPRFLPNWEFVVIAICIGLISHIFNALPDLQIDKESQLGGLVVSLGKTKSRLLVLALSVISICAIFRVFVI